MKDRLEKLREGLRRLSSGNILVGSKKADLDLSAEGILRERKNELLNTLRLV
jgi:hypothetical protein